MGKKKEVYTVISIAFVILWAVYFLFFYKYYTDAIGLVTEGAKKDIQILELFYYRGPQTITILVSYFVLMSLDILFIQFMKIQSFFELNLKKIYIINFILLVIMLVLSFINIFWILFLVLSIISCTLNFIIYTISKTRYSYIDGDLVFEKKGIETENSAKSLLNQYMENKASFFDRKGLILIGNVVKNDDKSYSIEFFVEEKE